MEWRKRETPSTTVAVLAGSFHPPTRAHMALAAAALRQAGEVVFVLPRAFPHKDYDGPGFEERMEIVLRAAAHEPRFAVASCAGGLFLEIARALCESDERIERILFVTGRDAAERIVKWDYTGREPIERQLREYELLVAPRAGAYLAPEHLRERVTLLELEGDLDHVSSTELRRRIGAGQEWRELAAPGTEELIERVYRIGG